MSCTFFFVGCFTPPPHSLPLLEPEGRGSDPPSSIFVFIPTFIHHHRLYCSPPSLVIGYWPGCWVQLNPPRLTHSSNLTPPKIFSWLNNTLQGMFSLQKCNSQTDDYTSGEEFTDLDVGFFLDDSSSYVECKPKCGKWPLTVGPTCPPLSWSPPLWPNLTRQ